jgi:uncharacterized protein YbbC (DUF1343 family)
MEGWDRGRWFDDTGLPWVNPSPNIRSLTQALLYSGVGLLEATNLSVGRGTEQPFEVVGAPWIDGPALAAYLQRRHIPGVAFKASAFTPTADRHARQRCSGVHIDLVDRASLDGPRLGVELAAAMRRLYPQRFALRDVQTLLASRRTLAAIAAGEDPAAIAESWRDGIDAFAVMRGKYLLY